MIYLLRLGSFYSYLVGLGGDKGCCFLLLELKPRDVDKLLPNRLNEFCAVSDGVSFLLSKAVFESYPEVGVSSLRKKLPHSWKYYFCEFCQVLGAFEKSCKNFHNFRDEMVVKTTENCQGNRIGALIILVSN